MTPPMPHWHPSYWHPSYWHPSYWHRRGTPPRPACLTRVISTNSWLIGFVFCTPSAFLIRIARVACESLANCDQPPASHRIHCRFSDRCKSCLEVLSRILIVSTEGTASFFAYDITNENRIQTKPPAARLSRMMLNTCPLKPFFFHFLLRSYAKQKIKSKANTFTSDDRSDVR